MLGTFVSIKLYLRKLILVARLAQSVEHQTFTAENFSEISEGHGFKSHIGREWFYEREEQILTILWLNDHCRL